MTDNPANIAAVHATDDVEQKKSRSCDACRRKKARCDGDESTRGIKCKKCTTSNIECTYTLTGRERNPSRTTRVRQLEQRQQVLQTLLKRFLPNTDLSGDFDLEHVSSLLSMPETWELELLQYCRVTAEHSDWESDEGSNSLPVLDSHPASLKGRYYGEYSSERMFVLAWKAQQQSTGEAAESTSQFGACEEGHKPEVLPWEEHLHSPNGDPSDLMSFPEPSLLFTLADLYFTHVNLFMPLLHEPTFTDNLKLELHLTDVSFARVVLLVCAIGARFCPEDPRVLSDGAQSALSAGWKWFNQAQRLEERMLAPASLYEIQACCLRAEFLRSAGPAAVFWMAIGIGMRRAQDVGIHRWKSFGNQKSAERELWVRAWWCLVVMDRIASAVTGQSSSASSSYDFDAGLPTDCDDEFWDHPDPEKAWKQPEGVPSKVAFFISHIRLSAILSSVLEYEYANTKCRVLYMVDLYQDIERKIVMELDSAVNKWIDSIPDHLRNPGNQCNPVFQRQSTVLYGELYLLQILMHRPFLASPDTQAELTTYSMAICTNAARACSRLLDVGGESARDVLHRVQWPIFSAAVVLLLSIWTSKKSRSLGSYPKEMINVEKCVEMLRHAEKCCQSAGQNMDILQSLISASDLNSPSSQLSTQSSAVNSLGPVRSENPAFTPSSGDMSIFSKGVPMYLDDMPIASGSSVNTEPWMSPTFTSDLSPASTMTSLSTLNSNAHSPASVTSPSLNRTDTGAHQSTPFDPPDHLDSGPVNVGLDLGSLLLNSHPGNLFELDPDTFAILSKAPLGLDVEEWKAYVDDVGKMQGVSGMGGRVT